MAPAPAAAPRPALGERTLVRHRTPRRWVRWAVPASVAAGVAALFGGMAVQSGLSMGGLPSGTAEDAAGAPRYASTSFSGEILVSGRNYDQAGIDSGRATAATPPAETFGTLSSPKNSATMKVVEGVPSSLTRLSAAAVLQECLDAIAGTQPGQAVQVDFARFEKAPALIVTIVASDGRFTFVAGAGCGLSGPDELYRAKNS